MLPIYLFILLGLLTATVATADAAEATLILTNGDKLNADIIAETAETVTLNHPVLGKIVINRNKITSITSKENISESKVATAEVATPPAVVDQAEKPVEKVVEPGVFGTSFLQGWQRRFDLGVAGSAGKSKNQQINVAFTANLDNKYTRIDHKTSYYRSESDGDLTDSSFYSDLSRDWLRPETAWFQFAGGRFDLDEFKDWDYRVNVNGGMGYEFINNDQWLLVVRTGLGFNQTFGGEREEFTPEGLLGVESRWQMNEYQKVHFSNILYPALNHPAEYRNLTEFDWILDLNSYAGVALKLGLTNEYDTQTDEGLSKNDFKYTVSLSWQL